MASRADALGQPAESLPLGSAVRLALGDLYYHSWRLVPANIVWSIAALVVIVLTIVTPAGFVAVPVLAIPTAGLFRMTGRIARAEAVSFWDSVAAWREEIGTTLALGAALGLLALVLGLNLVTGILAEGVLGWAFATLAFWGLLGTWLFAWAAWPLLADPWRAAWPARQRLRLAGYLLLAHPIRLAVLGLFLLVLLVASAVAIVALLTVSVAIASLIASRYVLPAADGLDAQLDFGGRRSLPRAGPPGDDGHANLDDGDANLDEVAEG